MNAERADARSAFRVWKERERRRKRRKIIVVFFFPAPRSLHRHGSSSPIPWRFHACTPLRKADSDETRRLKGTKGQTKGANNSHCCSSSLPAASGDETGRRNRGRRGERRLRGGDDRNALPRGNGRAGERRAAGGDAARGQTRGRSAHLFFGRRARCGGGA